MNGYYPLSSIKIYSVRFFLNWQIRTIHIKMWADMQKETLRYSVYINTSVWVSQAILKYICKNSL